MIIKRSTLLLILMTAAVSISLFVVKYRVQDLDDQMRSLSRENTATQRKHSCAEVRMVASQPAVAVAYAGRKISRGRPA